MTGNKKTFTQWITSGKVNRRLCIITFMLVPLALLTVFTYIPFAKMIGFSFYDMKYIGSRQFVGLQNYIEVFTRKDCFNALKLRLYYFGASVVQLGLALYFATILSFKTKGGGFFKGLMFFPYLVCGIAVGFIFKFFYNLHQTRNFLLLCLIILFLLIPGCFFLLHKGGIISTVAMCDSILNLIYCIDNTIQK